MKPARAGGGVRRIVEALAADLSARLVKDGDVWRAEGGAKQRAPRLADAEARRLVADGVLAEAEPGRLAAAVSAAAWLKRQARPALGFRAQHGAVEAVPSPDGGQSVQIDRDESPVGALARRVGPDGAPFLAAHLVAAAERLRRDFERGQLQPRITANWSASINTGRRSGGGTAADLTEAALAARIRVDRAVAAVGPELSGILVDVCCFLKGLETVERERRWPARSAKLVLRLGLEALARHYGLAESAAGPASGARIRHWGGEGYRPKVS